SGRAAAFRPCPSVPAMPTDHGPRATVTAVRPRPWQRAAAGRVSLCPTALTSRFPGQHDACQPAAPRLLAQTGEQVLFGQRCPGRVAGPDEAFPAEGGLGDVGGNFTEPRFLDLAGMSEQGITLAGKHRPDVNCGGDPPLGRLHLSAHLRGYLTRPGHVCP